ncbi:hypothetical protein E8D34_09455 [Nocardioides sp. GY 10113]|uniref:hypothetical protein n=1 Tax=Nocardioides sp. GY 10113 TaxID=2569761 RepID=UPI0010A77516|nr:hypothetical protein [Nocardioides sp. GY 10113]TIC87353.1 hypothetical protein E8D34_09455 [Nocardioides sp. GY 10113]
MVDSYDVAWQVLVEALASCYGDAGVAQRAPHGLVVAGARADGSRFEVEIVMTPDEWDDLAAVAWGDVDAAAAYVVGLVRGQPADLRYLVYRLYELTPRGEPTIPPEPEDR